MRSIQIILFSAVLMLIPLTSLSAKKNIKALFDYKVFYAPGTGSYLETYLQFAAGNLNYVEVAEGGIQSNVEIILIVRQGDTIVDYKKYEIASPIVKDSILEDMYDVQRFALSPGEYELEIELRDLNKKGAKPMSGFVGIEVEDYAQGGLSGISFVEFANKTDNKKDPFYKSGYQIVPYLSTYYSNDMDMMIYYLEGYNFNKAISKDDAYILIVQIEDYTSRKRVGQYMNVKRRKDKEVMVSLGTFNIQTLPTGDYYLTAYVLDKNNDTLHTEERYFERYKKTDEILDYVEIETLHSFEIGGDSIAYYVESLTPICGRAEQANIYDLLKEGDTTKLKKYMAFFWTRTDALEPVRAWKKYKQQVDIVEVYYGTQIKRGFQADRGRVRLQYGAPTEILERPNEPSAYPYEIWQYNKIENQSNRKFIFYNPDLVTNDYALLHSDMRGELQNYRWQHDLMKRNSPASNFDDPADGVLDHWGGNAFRNVNR